LNQLDFTGAFARLLRDGALRDQFAAGPRAAAERMNLSAADQAAVAALDPEDLEFQALVLLRKRFDSVRRLVPRTCTAAGTDAWLIFREYARKCWPCATPLAIHDAANLCRRLREKNGASPCRSEQNRLDFALRGKWLALRLASDLFVNGRTFPAIQVFLRSRNNRFVEYDFYFRL
jgi:hypothetical protein